jgi:pimeloyl-ACP methyl ester carboxylesterase
MNGYLLDFRVDPIGGAVSSGELYRVVGDREIPVPDRTEFTAATRGELVLVLLHGYNVNREKGLRTLSRYGDMLAKGGFGGLLVATLWPGDGWAKALTYPFEGRDADDTGDVLYSWLAENAAPTSRIAFVAHSLGCRVAMHAARRLARRWRGPTLDRICLMAAAIDNDSLGCTRAICYRHATLKADRVAVLASEEDEVLRFAYPLGDLAQTLLFGGGWGGALGRTGPKETDPSIRSRIEPVPRSRRERQIDHGDYLNPPRGHSDRTVAESEIFVLAFLDRQPNPVWPPQR